MNQAIILAQRAFAHDDVPIGAVIVRNGKIIARGENMVQKKQNPTLKNIYFAATDEKGGGITANARVFDNDKHLWHPNIIQMPEYADKSAELLREFFKQRRKSKETQDAK